MVGKHEEEIEQKVGEDGNESEDDVKESEYVEDE